MRVRTASSTIFAAAAVIAAAAACSSESAETSTVPARACGLRVWHKAASTAAHVEIVGDWDNWKRPGIVPSAAPNQKDDWRVADIDTTVGEHAYGIVEDGVWLTDRNEPMTSVHDGREVSLATAVQCDSPALRVDGVDSSSDGKATVRATFLSARDKKKIDSGSITAKGRNGETLNVAAVDAEHGTITLETSGLMRGKYTYTIEAKDASGRVAENARATVWVTANTNAANPSGEPWDPRDAIVYQVVLDRFRGDDGPLAPPASPSARAGGTLRGVRQALESGEIEKLGATAIWLSPLYDNPRGEFAGNDGRPYSSYHGYWPIASRALDDRVTSEAELEAFMKAAHERGIRVLFDVVPNHVHQEHPYAKEHSDWFKQDCVCGQGTCDWGEHIKTCWFAPYLPDLDWTNTEAARAETDDVMWWFDRWDADGIRIDAVPMMPRSATRRIAATARGRYAHPGNALYVLGENFTGPGAYQSLRYDLGPYGLDGSFHFPLMWTLRESIALEGAPMSAIDESFRAGEDAWNGANAVMGLIIGNHDVARFASASAGNADGDAWSAPAQPIDPTVYAKQRLALASILTLPGAPVLYYGDEVGLAGRSDPDCRRVMPAESALIDAQRETRELTGKIGRTRACSRALRRGDLKTLLADKERFVFTRRIDNEEVIVSLARRPTTTVDVPVSHGALIDVVKGSKVEPGATLLLGNEPFEIQVFVSADGACTGR